MAESARKHHQRSFGINPAFTAVMNNCTE